MERTCIICGNAAGSAEHIFPAALGGRRKNKSIYCDAHNVAYSGHVGLLASQLEPLNALLEVRSDRTKQVRPAGATEVDSGESMHLVGGKADFTTSRILRQEQQTDGSVVQHHSMLSKKDAWARIDEMREQGVLLGHEKPRWTPRVLGSVHLQIKLGSALGLRAAGYILQTYLAHEFPDLARSAALDDFKAYTLGAETTPKVWWDFKLPGDYPENAFRFGHRVLVGVDPKSGVIYGRLTLFSTVSFAAQLGQILASDAPPAAVVIDIDPRAAHPPHDQTKSEVPAGAYQPAPPVANELESAINSGAAQAAFGRLLNAIEDDMRDRQARDIVARLTAKGSSEPEEKEEVLGSIGEEISQRAYNLATYFVDGLAREPGLAGVAASLEELLRLDPTAIYGISNEGFQALQDCTSALVAQLREDWTSGGLTQDNVSMLIGGGRGAAIVGELLLTKYAGMTL